MKTSPSQLYQTKSQAEQLVFRQLKQVFNHQESYVAMHSVLLTNHPSKRFSEIDFLLCTNLGLFVLEVKGGRVSCRSGIWHYQDRNGNKNTGGSPFHQANEAMQGLKQSLLTRFDKSFVDKICFGYGVILTDSILPKEIENTLEHDKPMLCQGGEHNHLQKWLMAFFDYWQKRNRKIMPNIKILQNQELSDVIKFIRPDFECINNEDIDLKKPNNNYKEFGLESCNKIILNNIYIDDNLKTQLKEFIFKYYEKMIDGNYFLARDISIVIDNFEIEKEIVSLSKQLRLKIKIFDEYSFNFRKSYELSLFHYKTHLGLRNKIVIAVFSQNSEEYCEHIKNCATHTAQIFYYEIKNQPKL